jgi:protease II
MFCTDTDTGRGGASGRLEACRETAPEHAFLLKCAG